MGALKNNAESDSIRCLLDCARRLAETGFEVPDWTDLAEGKVAGDEGEDDPCQPKIGWQKQAANSVEECFFSNTVWPSLGDSERALGLSQCGPLASVRFVCFPIDRTRRFDSQPFRLLLLRRLRLPLPCVSAVAGVAVLSTPLAITGQLARTRRCWGEGGGLSSQQRREYVVRQVRACAHVHPRHGLWYARHPRRETPRSAGGRCRSTEVLSSPLTLPWCHPSTGTESH